jgi:hypothetical protein
MDPCDFLEEMIEWAEIINTPAIYKRMVNSTYADGHFSLDHALVLQSFTKLLAETYPNLSDEFIEEFNNIICSYYKPLEIILLLIA